MSFAFSWMNKIGFSLVLNQQKNYIDRNRPTRRRFTAGILHARNISTQRSSRTISLGSIKNANFTRVGAKMGRRAVVWEANEVLAQVIVFLIRCTSSVTFSTVSWRSHIYQSWHISTFFVPVGHLIDVTFQLTRSADRLRFKVPLTSGESARNRCQSVRISNWRTPTLSYGSFGERSRLLCLHFYFDCSK